MPTNTPLVVWLGLPQAEAYSISQTFRILGYTPYDIIEIFNNKGQSQRWIDILLGRARLKKDLFEGYGALVCTPPASFHAELLALYPDAKFIVEDMDVMDYYRRYKRISRVKKFLGSLKIIVECLNLGKTVNYGKRLRRFVKTT